MQRLGSKKRLAPKLWETIVKHVPITDETYFVDLFCGGCGMASYVPLKNKIANDKSKPLIAYLRKIVKDTSWLPKENNITKEEYEHMRENQHLYPLYQLGYVGNNYSFNGQYFQGFANYKNNANIALRAYKSAVKDAEALKNVKIYNRDYKNVPIPPKSIVYCDIPYKGTAKYNDIDEEFDYDEFYRYVKKLRKQGHYVFISEYTTEVPNGIVEIGQYKRKSNMRNSGKSRTGRKFAEYKRRKKK